MQDLADLKKIGRPGDPDVVRARTDGTLWLHAACAPRLLGITRLGAAVMGSALAAVSPAVVVPGMLRLMQERRGTRQRIPELILAGASYDDLFVLVRFSSVTGMAQGRQLRTAVFPSMPGLYCAWCSRRSAGQGTAWPEGSLPATLLILPAPLFQAVGVLLFLIATPAERKKSAARRAVHRTYGKHSAPKRAILLLLRNKSGAARFRTAAPGFYSETLQVL